MCLKWHMTFSRTGTNFPTACIFERIQPHSSALQQLLPSRLWLLCCALSQKSFFWISIFFFFPFYFFLILLPSAAAQVHLQLEIGGWCKAHQQNHNCHGNCRGIWQKILQTHILWNTERFTWSSIVQSFGGSLNETDIDLYVKVVLSYFDPII